MDRDSIRPQYEKQILVDPISLAGNGYGDIHPYPVVTGRMEVMPVPPHAGKTDKFTSCNSAFSSPRFTTKHKQNRNDPPLSPHHHGGHMPLGLARQNSVALTNLERLRENHLRRSKSCGEGRASQPSVDFDIWSVSKKGVSRNHGTALGGTIDGEKKAIMSTSQVGQLQLHKQEPDGDGDTFKCGVCLFLPGFGKGKAVKARNDEDLGWELHAGLGLSASTTLQQQQRPSNVEVVSQRVSLERFECGSWRSSAMINCYDGEGDDNSGALVDATSSNLFFDLPVELIRCNSVNDAESPVTSGFLFDHHHDVCRKGVLKNTSSSKHMSMIAIGGGNGRKSQESSPRRHVRFSASSPKVATPRFLHSGRDDDGDNKSTTNTNHYYSVGDDLNAFLEAQNA